MRGIFPKGNKGWFQKGHSSLTSFKKGHVVKHSEETRKKISIANKGKIRTISQREKYSDSHRGKIRSEISGENHYAWKGGLSESGKRRRQWKRKNGGSHTKGEWENLKAQYNWSCPHCFKMEPEIKLTEDHIIPLSKGGSDNIENIQPLCGPCNSKKSAKILTV